ncbi:hypothetical protein SFC42_21525 [Priestia filamentosa]|uniref:hypothetical protein n=1 Tax=Priestia filamentosa TaxID=1402861 RepID=UPI003983C37D
MSEYEEKAECEKCGGILEENEAFNFVGYDEEYCKDCYYDLLSEEEEAENYSGPDADSNGVCDYCGKSRIYNQCTCY